MWPFGRKRTAEKASSAQQDAESVAPAEQSAETGEPIRMVDQFGREVMVPRDTWCRDVLLPNLERAKDNPDALYSMILDALETGFARQVMPYAERTTNSPGSSLRDWIMLGIVYLELGEADRAEQVFNDCLKKWGKGANGEECVEAGVVYTNLAKVYAAQGKESQVEKTLWHALELDPNQSNGFSWYLSIVQKSQGEEGVKQALHSLMQIPGSWRARLSQGRYELTNKQIEPALALFAEAIAIADTPSPTDLLMEISGELGVKGFLAELLELVMPRFSPAHHGFAVGNNLIKANFELHRYDRARDLVETLYALQQPAWRSGLDYWERELAKVGLEIKNRRESAKPELVSFTVDAPLWARNGSPFIALVPPKTDDATRIAIVGSSAVLGTSAAAVPKAQLSDGPGRLSRVVPLALAEQILFSTNGVGSVIMPWAQRMGFVLYGAKLEDSDLCAMINGAEHAPQFVAGLTIEVSDDDYVLCYRLLRAKDGMRVAGNEVRAKIDNPGPAVTELIEIFTRQVVSCAGLKAVTPPKWYQPGWSAGAMAAHSSDYLLRMEQQLAVMCCNIEFLEGAALNGEREILDGTLQLALSQPENITARILLAQTLREMKKARPAVIEEYVEKVQSLQRLYPIDTSAIPDVETALNTTMLEVLGSS